jgi:hypothetical protein
VTELLHLIEITEFQLRPGAYLFKIVPTENAKLYFLVSSIGRDYQKVLIIRVAIHVKDRDSLSG